MSPGEARHGPLGAEAAAPAPPAAGGRASPSRCSASALSLDAVSKAFDGHPALVDAHFDVRWGEVHALLGENGAGKSTLMSVACGLYTADQGALAVDGRAVAIAGPADAMGAGIGMLHQHFKLVSGFTVAENVLLACSARLGIRTLHDATARARETARSLGFDIDPGARTGELSIAERQRLEIVKLIMLGADVLILDEPTAVLTDDEADAVLELMRALARAGKAVVLITHRLREVTGYADRVTIMRNGRTVCAGAAAADMTQSALARAMVGEDLDEFGDSSVTAVAETAPVRLAIESLSVRRGDGSLALSGIELTVRAGEIVGVAGVGGNGQTELAEAVFGLHDIASGHVAVDGHALDRLPILERRRRGLRLVPADRFAYSLLADLAAYENLAITGVPDGRFGAPHWISRRAMKRTAAELFLARDITGGRPTTRSRLLSGGNAQKLLLARELDDCASVLVAHSPTRGLDVRACRLVHEAIAACVRRGAACLLISEDLDEVLRLSSRVAVLSRGVLHGPLPRGEADRARIGELMAGHA